MSTSTTTVSGAVSLKAIEAAMRELDRGASLFNPNSLFNVGCPLKFMGMDVIEAKEQPVLQLSEHVGVSDEFRKEMNAWLLERFGMRSAVPEGRVYLMMGHTLVMNPRDLLRLSYA